VAHGEPVREFAEVFAVENRGLRGCVHGRKGSSRQVLLMDIETLEEFGLRPGRVKENITTRGLALAELVAEQHVRVGDALLEVTKLCEPCHQIEEIRPGLQHAMDRRRGILCRVVQSGRICRGDGIAVVEKEKAAS
jgi:MOSC domain-containing protein YiiM